MFNDCNFAGSALLGRDGRVTIPADVRARMELDEGNDQMIFYFCKTKNNKEIVIMEKGV
jgi:bifunctional DNA-binding transcriptional regulator/antitoxin component of YhaV-PrlF toxin-antitoxin module